MAKPQRFTLKIGDERHELVLSPRDAARAATRIAKGTFVRSKSMWEQPPDAALGRAVKLLDESGAVVMSCRPTILARRKQAGHTFAACDVAPSFRSKIRKRRRTRR